MKIWRFRQGVLEGVSEGVPDVVYQQFQEGDDISVIWNIMIWFESVSYPWSRRIRIWPDKYAQLLKILKIWRYSQGVLQGVPEDDP